MKFIKYFIPLLVVGITTSAYAQQRAGQETAFSRELNTRDDQPVREFVQSKENIDVKDKAKNLEISGDVRFEWRSIQEKGEVFYLKRDSSSGHDYDYDYNYDSDSSSSSGHELSEGKIKREYRYLRGGDHVDDRGIPVSTNDFDVEFNLKIKYTFKDAWAKAHLQFDNPAGIRGRNACFGTFPVFNEDGDEVVRTVPRDSRWALKGSGEAMSVNLKRAYMGYNIYADGRHRVDIEIGRQKLDDIFDSEIEFTARFDGILLRFAGAIEEALDWYVLAGAFVIDERVNHFGYAGEVGFLDIYDTGIDIKYNLINWKKRGKNRCFIINSLGSEFLNSQVCLTYNFARTICCKEIPFEFYSGFLINHAAKKTKFTHGKRKNLGWYAGLYIGNVDKKGDWAFDIEYVGVQAQAVPEYDVGSIGRGNILDENLLDILDASPRVSSSESFSSSDHLVGLFPRRGNTNFIGWRFEFLYAITDNFSLDFIAEFSREEDKHIGGRHHYRDFEVEAIYAF